MPAPTPDWYNVGDYYATYGATLKAINQAIADSGTAGGVIYIPRGTYVKGSYADSNIDLSGKSNLIVLGDGEKTIINFPSGTDIGLGTVGGTAAANITIQKIHFGGSSTRTLAFTSGSAQIRIEDCTVTGATLITSDQFTAGIYLKAVSDAWIQDNRLTENGCRASDGPSSSNILVDAGCERIVIARNNCDTGTITAGSLESGGDRLVTVGIDAMGKPTAAVSVAGGTLSAGDAGKGLVVAGNRVVIKEVAAGGAALTLDMAWPVDFGPFTNSAFELEPYSGNAVTLGIAVQDSRRVEIVDNYSAGSAMKPSKQAWGYGIAVYNNALTPDTYHNLVCRNRIHGCFGTGIYIQGSSHTVISENVIDEVCKTIASSSLLNAAIAVNATANHCIVSKNVIHASRQNGIELQAPRCQIVSNVIESAVDGTATLFGVCVRAHANGFFDGGVLRNNTIKGCLAGIGTLGFREAAGPDAAVRGSGLVVAHNTVFDPRASDQNNGIGISSFDDVVVSGNRVRLARAAGIAVANGSNVTITDNVVEDSSQYGDGVHSGILVASLKQSLVSRNRSGNRMGTAIEQKYGIEANDCVVVTITSNIVYNNGTSGIEVAGLDAGTVSRWGNRVSEKDPLSGQKQLGTGGTVTVSTVEIQTGDNILLTVIAPGTDPSNIGSPRVDSIAGGTGFVIKSTNAADRSFVFWQIVH